jgi:uncharacterized protein (DUF1810 family)
MPFLGTKNSLCLSSGPFRTRPKRHQARENRCWQYAIKSPEEARQYPAHPFLGPRLLECAEADLAIEGRSAFEIFGSPDDLKFKSCMTLFETVAGRGSVFGRALDKYYQGQRDTKTLEILAAMKD